MDFIERNYDVNNKQVERYLKAIGS